jgi:hypothetical protein
MLKHNWVRSSGTRTAGTVRAARSAIAPYQLAERRNLCFKTFGL